MYRIFTLLSTLIFFSVFFAHSQGNIKDNSNYKAIFEVTYQTDSTDVNSKRVENMQLLLGEKYSLFQSVNSIYNDSVKGALATSSIDISTAVNRVMNETKKTRFNYKILKNSEETLVFDTFFSDKFIYSDNEKLNWQLLNENKLIDGYKCQKAKTEFAGRNYIAWFTAEIPQSDGPYKFKNLPGFIVEIYDEEAQYHFKLIEFVKSNQVFLFDQNKGQKVTKKDFFKAYNNFKKSFISQLYQRGISIDGSNSREIQKRIQKSRNNEIEIRY